MKTFLILTFVLSNSLSFALSPSDSYQLLNKTFGYIDTKILDKLKKLDKDKAADYILRYSLEEENIEYSWLHKVNFLMESGFNCFVRRKYKCDESLKEQTLKRNYNNFRELVLETKLNFRGIPKLEELTLEEFQNHLTRGSGFQGRLNSKLYKHFQTSSLNTWIQNENGFLDKMSLFFQNHFVSTLRESRSVPMMHDQYNLIRENVLGNFKELVHKITLDPAMLKYLDGDGNKCIKVDGKCQAPNENYARELMELFTLGVNPDNGAGNCYTEDDIKNAAQALTGYSVDRFSRKLVFTKKWSDFNKSIKAHPKKDIFSEACFVEGFDQIPKAQSFVTNTYSLIEVLFKRRGKQIARFVTDKILSEFISPNHPQYQRELNKIQKKFYKSNFELKTIYKSMLTSKLLYSSKNKLTHVRSPLEVFLNIYKIFSHQKLDKKNVNSITHILKLAKQGLFSQPDVKGWRTGYHWIDTSSYTYRLELVNRTFSNLLPKICKKNINRFKRKIDVFIDVFEIREDFKFERCADLKKLRKEIIGTDFIQKR